MEFSMKTLSVAAVCIFSAAASSAQVVQYVVPAYGYAARAATPVYNYVQRMTPGVYGPVISYGVPWVAAAAGPIYQNSTPMFAPQYGSTPQYVQTPIYIYQQPYWRR